MGEIKFTNGLVMGAVFAICIILFAIGFAGDNSSEVSLSQDSTYSSLNSSVQSDIISFKEAVNSSSYTLSQENVEEGTDTATSGGQFKVTTTSAFGMAKRTLKDSFNKIFGNEFSWVFIALSSVLLLMFVRYIYKTWFGKDPD